MQKVQPISVVIAAHSFVLSRDDFQGAARGLIPEPLRDHYAVIDGVRFPPKQLIAAATGVDRADFTTNQARAILRRLGFATGRATEARKPSRRTAEATVPNRSTEADRLRPHRGRWVAIKDGQVMVAAETPDRVLTWLRTHGGRADSMFRVPLDPSIDLGGFPG